jgi:hypothetical protein
VRIVFALSIMLRACVPAANASCLPGVPPPTFYVGSDNQCTYTKIQDAITAVSTTATCAPIIYVTNEHNPWNEALTITNRTFTLIGTTSACSTGGTHRTADAAAVTSPQATISGAGRNAPVITINGTSRVTLQALEITGGNMSAENSQGGGVNFTGAGSLTLNVTTVDGNKSDYGAGIAMSPSGSATLTLQPYSLIINNQAATSGGGIRIEGNTQLIAVSDQTLVYDNTAANGYGGGIEILGPAYANIGSPGYGLQGVVSGNTAAYGGGIAALGGNDGNENVFLQLFTTVAERPVTIEDNVATISGGGIYLRPKENFTSDSYASMCLFDFRVDGNAAPEGAGLASDNDTETAAASLGSRTYLNVAYDADNCGPRPPSDFNAIACAADAACNELSHNNPPPSSGPFNPSGGIIFSGTDGYFQGVRFKLQDNYADYAMHILGGSPSFASLSYAKACLLTDNHFSQYDFFGDGDSFDNIEFTNCTLANNLAERGYMFRIGTAATVNLHKDIFDEFGSGTVSDPGDTTLRASYILANDTSTLPTSPTIVDLASAPLFVDAAHGNYHLVAYYQNGSLTATRAIDFAPEDGDPPYDLDSRAYGKDVPAVPDAYGTRDLGAYEAIPITDRIFADAFGDRTSLVY